MLPVLLSALLFAEPETPAAQFALCSDSAKHVALKSNSTNYIIHFHVEFTHCEKRKVYARVRCVQDTDNGPREHIDTKLVDVTGEKERWSFYMVAPRFDKFEGKTKYQVEIGYIDPEDPTEYMLLDSFGWRMKDGKVISKEGDGKPVMIQVSRKVIVRKEGGGFAIRTVYETRVRTIALRYGIWDALPDAADGERCARKLE
jgi:hypothetical protein